MLQKNNNNKQKAICLSMHVCGKRLIGQKGAALTAEFEFMH
jgi:hypothetical protein